MQTAQKIDVWPPLITPFLSTGEVDYAALGRLVDYYIEEGVAGLLVLGLSAEPYELSEVERGEVAAYVAKKINGRVSFAVTLLPGERDQMARTAEKHLDLGACANVLMASALVSSEATDSEFAVELQVYIDDLPGSLGLYEAPMPYKRILGAESYGVMVESKRFSFLKDTCQDESEMARRAQVSEGIDLFNAEIYSLLSSLQSGYTGFCGIMANLYPRQIRSLAGLSQKGAERLMGQLTIGDAVLEKEYPASAKYILANHRGLEFDSFSRRLGRPADPRALTSLIAFENHISMDNY